MRKKIKYLIVLLLQGLHYLVFGCILIITLPFWVLITWAVEEEATLKEALIEWREEFKSMVKL